MKPKVFVSGCFDDLHSGHIAFLREASLLGDVYVSVASDATIEKLKNRRPHQPQEERLYRVRSIRYVTEAQISRDVGVMDFVSYFDHVFPDIFFVNSDGDTKEKRDFCSGKGVSYAVGDRQPPQFENIILPARATSDVNIEKIMPYRLDLGGAWFDQPFLNGRCQGAVAVVSIEPDERFRERCGLATSTRKIACRLWNRVPNFAQAESLFHQLHAVDKMENPGAGSQDAIGIVYPGITFAWYNHGSTWPTTIVNRTDEELLCKLEKMISLIPLRPRGEDYNPYIGASNEAGLFKNSTYSLVENIRYDKCSKLPELTLSNFVYQIALFPAMVPLDIRQVILKEHQYCQGYKLTGAGGGGYLMVYNYRGPTETIPIRIRRE